MLAVVGFALSMFGLRLTTGFLTREERLVFLTVSLCLLGGGLFHLASSVFDLPDAIDPRAEPGFPSGVEGGTYARGRQLRGTTVSGSDEAGSGEYGAGRDETPVSGSGAVSEAARGAEPGRVGKLELNDATQAELDALPGIGPALAQRILEQRRRVGGFKSVDDLLDVKGIGEKTLSRFRANVYVSGSQK